MSEVYQRESVAIPHDEVEETGFTPPPAAPPRRRPGNGTWWRHGLAVLALIWSMFPIVFIVCTGALQSIPGDVREAANIDGANAFRMLR